MKPTDRKNPIGYRWIMQQIDHQGDQCLIWPFSCCTPGYGMFMFETKRRLAHRFMCEQKYGPAPDDSYHAAHSCGNRRCVNPGHLSWKTQSDNQLDRRTHGTNNKTRRKITQMQADQIRALKGIETGIETAARYGITESNVRQIQDGKTWANRGMMHIWTAQDDAKLREALSQGHPARKVAELLGHDVGSVTGRMYRLKLRTQSGHHACKPT
jgi:hypothetical protein